MAKKKEIDLSRTMQKATEVVEETKAIIVSVEKEREKTIQKTTFFDREADFRLKAAKDIVNNNRAKGDKKITMDDLIFQFVMEGLERNYPQTKEMYELMK